MKVLTVEQVDVIDELLFNYVEKNKLSKYCSIPAVLSNIRKGVSKGWALVLVDNIEEPKSFIWGNFAMSPHLLTNMKEVIVMAGWAEDKEEANLIVKSLHRKAKIRGVEDAFVNTHYPFSLIDGGDYKRFEEARYKKL